MGSTYEFLGDKPATFDKAAELRQVPLFKNLSQEYIDAIARHAQELQADTGTVIVQQGQQGREVMLIREGSAHVERDERTVARLKSGDYFGEIALLDGKERSATVIADSHISYLAIDKQMFDSILESEPHLVRALLLTLCERIRSRPESPVEETI